MQLHLKIIFKNTVMISVAVFFSCTNDSKKVRDFLAEKNMPIAVAKNAIHVYKDSGKVSSKLITPLMYDFQNRKNHPYNEFPEGVKIVNYENDGKDSITVIGDYALSYLKTSISEIKGNVVVINHTQNSRLETSQLFWDQNNKYFFSEKAFILKSPDNTIRGIGFESKENLTKWVSKNITGDIITKEEDL